MAIPHGLVLPGKTEGHPGEMFIKDDAVQGSKLYVWGASGWELAAASSEGAVWGSITGDITDQTDLQEIIDAFPATTDDLIEGENNLYMDDETVAATAIVAISTGFKLSSDGATLPLDGDVMTGMVFCIFDATNLEPALSFKGKTADGTLFTHSIPLFTP